MGVTDLEEMGDLCTGIDNMSPKNPGLHAFAKIPLAPRIKGHSIISVDQFKGTTVHRKIRCHL